MKQDVAAYLRSASSAVKLLPLVFDDATVAASTSGSAAVTPDLAKATATRLKQDANKLAMLLGGSSQGEGVSLDEAQPLVDEVMVNLKGVQAMAVAVIRSKGCGPTLAKQYKGAATDLLMAFQGLLEALLKNGGSGPADVAVGVAWERCKAFERAPLDNGAAIKRRMLKSTKVLTNVQTEASQFTTADPGDDTVSTEAGGSGGNNEDSTSVTGQGLESRFESFDLDDLQADVLSAADMAMLEPCKDLFGVALDACKRGAVVMGMMGTTARECGGDNVANVAAWPESVGNAAGAMERAADDVLCEFVDDAVDVEALSDAFTTLVACVRELLDLYADGPAGNKEPGEPGGQGGGGGHAENPLHGSQGARSGGGVNGGSTEDDIPVASYTSMTKVKGFEGWLERTRSAVIDASRRLEERAAQKI